MGLTKAFINLSTLAENNNLRLCYLLDNIANSKVTIKLIDCLELYESGSRPKGGIVYLDGYKSAISLGCEQINKKGFVDLSKTPLIPFTFFQNATKGKILQNDILVCKDGAQTGKSCIIDNDFPIDDTMVNEHIFIFRSNDNIKQKILYYLFRSDFVQFQIRDLAYRKKGAPGLNTDHLTKIKIPQIDPIKQTEISNQIAQIEKAIKILLKSKNDPSVIINNVFAEKFNINVKKIINLDHINMINANFSEIHQNNIHIRNSYRWFKYKFLRDNIYSNINCIQPLGKYIKETRNGWSPLSIEGGTGTGILGQENFNYSGELCLSSTKATEVFRSDISTFFIKKGDFFVSRGNTIDLVALASFVNDEPIEDIIFPDLYIRVIFDEDFINKEYLALLFNSFIGRLYFKYVSKGKNQTMVKISSDELHNFYCPLPNPKEQLKIVSKNILNQNLSLHLNN